MTSDMAGLLPHWGIHLSPEAVDLLQRLITIDPRHRLTLDEALAHPWLQEDPQQLQFICVANTLIEQQLPQESGLRPDTPQEQDRLTFLSTCTYILQFCLNAYLE